MALAEGYVITRVYPKEGNEQVLGFDYRTNATQWPTVREAIEKEQTQAAGPVDLVQGGVGVITRTPIYIPDPKRPGERLYWGLSSVVIDFNTILDEAGLPDAESNYRIAIRGRDGLGAEGGVRWGDPELFQAKPVTMSVSFPNGSWQPPRKEGFINTTKRSESHRRDPHRPVAERAYSGHDPGQSQASPHGTA